MKSPKNRYTKIIEKIFRNNYREGALEVAFEREEIVRVAKELKITLPKNLGDLVYSFRYRADLPESILSKAPKNKQWIIRPKGRALYAFVATGLTTIVPQVMAEIKIPDSTPGVITKYALSDEQALLAKVRYNRLVDIFTGVTCYSLQNHLRTTVIEMGQVEIDEIYIGLDRRGAHYVLPVQAKGKKDKLGIVQIEQDIALCAAKFPSLICRPIAAQFTDDHAIAMFEFEETDKGIAISAERHYRLVPQEQMTEKDIEEYRKHSI
jgi:hypothetical protein